MLRSPHLYNSPWVTEEEKQTDGAAEACMFDGSFLYSKYNCNKWMLRILFTYILGGKKGIPTSQEWRDEEGKKKNGRTKWWSSVTGGRRVMEGAWRSNGGVGGRGHECIHYWFWELGLFQAPPRLYVLTWAPRTDDSYRNTFASACVKWGLYQGYAIIYPWSFDVSLFLIGKWKKTLTRLIPILCLFKMWLFCHELKRNGVAKND